MIKLYCQIKTYILLEKTQIFVITEHRAHQTVSDQALDTAIQIALKRRLSPHSLTNLSLPKRQTIHLLIHDIFSWLRYGFCWILYNLRIKRSSAQKHYKFIILGPHTLQLCLRSCQLGFQLSNSLLQLLNFCCTAMHGVLHPCTRLIHHAIYCSCSLPNIHTLNQHRIKTISFTS